MNEARAERLKELETSTAEELRERLPLVPAVEDQVPVPRMFTLRGDIRDVLMPIPPMYRGKFKDQ